MTTELQGFFESHELEFLRACQGKEAVHGTRGILCRLAVSTGREGQLVLSEKERKMSESNSSSASNAQSSTTDLGPQGCMRADGEEESEGNSDKSYVDTMFTSSSPSSLASSASTACSGSHLLVPDLAGGRVTRSHSGTNHDGYQMTLRSHASVENLEAESEEELEAGGRRRRVKRRKRSAKGAPKKKRSQYTDRFTEEEVEASEVMSGMSVVTSRGRVVKPCTRFS